MASRTRAFAVVKGSLSLRQFKGHFRTLKISTLQIRHFLNTKVAVYSSEGILNIQLDSKIFQIPDTLNKVLKKYLETINFPLAKIQLYVNPLPISIYINEKIGSKTVTTPLITEKIKNSLIQKNIKLIETDQAKYKIYFDFDTKESDQLVGNRISCSLNYTIKVYNASFWF